MTTPTTPAAPAAAPDRDLAGELYAAFRTMAEKFVPSEMHRGDRGTLATLRNSLGRDGGPGVREWEALGALVRPHWSDSEANAFFLAAGLFALHPAHAHDSGSWKDRGLGKSLRAIRWREGGDDVGVARRFLALLEARAEALPEHLRHLAKLLHSKKPEVDIDYALLALDILAWDHSSRHVQRRWAAGFWRGGPDAATETTAGASDAATATSDDNDD